ncbi:hypothetical protein PICSAR164_03830 [Mycobacterium avium subsp. paratuberculosis]|nr:hypothetical protein PICSAR164_03830 [Mycobacterium avium subsp. paratuberculosis]
MHRPGVHLVTAPGSRQHADAAVPRQRIAHRRPIEPAALQRQVRPAQPRGVLAAEQQLDPAAPRVEVHQQRVAGGLGQGDREQGGPGAAAASDDGDRVPALPVVARRFGRFGELTDQVGFVFGQPQHPRGADAHGRRPRRRRGFGRRQHRDVIAAGQRPAPAARRRRSVQHDGRGRRPGLTTHRGRVTGVHHPHPGGGRHPIQLGAQLGFGQHRQHTRRTRRVIGALRTGAASHPSTVRGRDVGTPVPDADLGIETPLCTNPARARTASDGGPILRNAPSTGRSARNPGETARKDPRKGTTPARGGRRRGSSCISPGGSG